MNKINYNQKMNETIKGLNGEKPKLLLHSCCAPCSSACIEKLKDYFEITVYYYNPNIDGEEEFNLRASEQERFCREVGVQYVIEKYNDKEFLSKVEGLENQPEGGARCEKCFRIRLEKTAKTAKNNGFNFFATTLTVSPLKNADLLNRIGYTVSEQIGIKYLPSDFKKESGYLRSIELSKQFSLYRQKYCGCKFSKR